MDDWRCDRCGEVIGVYEPLIVVDGDEERVSSRLLEPQLETPQGGLYHAECRAAGAD